MWLPLVVSGGACCGTLATGAHLTFSTYASWSLTHDIYLIYAKYISK